MACRQLASVNQFLDRVWKIKQSQGVSDVATTFSDNPCQRPLSMLEFVHQTLITLRLLQRRQIGALNILDQGDFKGLGIIEIFYHHGQLVQLSLLRRPPAPLASDDFEIFLMTGHAPHQ